ncbi:uncharacterized protein K452DRAFT_307317 [Aplosporella prunicola CBS 121167]|uniref:Uncharacterized protein n=1 Tax=Aplosporella prunicola CBS 121167 TaxID=1176127 RepID=A0A6A6BG50_9PEZI|nr:uncharacterized protein K452DRAFT_307317 [Aplosporella prunicola CBS 121167]KAF2143140.1 hypothetical protein K452DRAFT_307317 [Aplosporella prunicola CBS 121167]
MSLFGTFGNIPTTSGSPGVSFPKNMPSSITAEGRSSSAGLFGNNRPSGSSIFGGATGSSTTNNRPTGGSIFSPASMQNDSSRPTPSTGIHSPLPLFGGASLNAQPSQPPMSDQNTSTGTTERDRNDIEALRNEIEELRRKLDNNTQNTSDLVEAIKDGFVDIKTTLMDIQKSLSGQNDELKDARMSNWSLRTDVLGLRDDVQALRWQENSKASGSKINLAFISQSEFESAIKAQCAQVVLPPFQSMFTGGPIPDFPKTVGDLEKLSAEQIDEILHHLLVKETPEGLEQKRKLLKEKIWLKV